MASNAIETVLDAALLTEVPNLVRQLIARFRNLMQNRIQIDHLEQNQIQFTIVILNQTQFTAETVLDAALLTEVSILPSPEHHTLKPES